MCRDVDETHTGEIENLHHFVLSRIDFHPAPQSNNFRAERQLKSQNGSGASASLAEAVH
jgi:hypothetical protein